MTKTRKKTPATVTFFLGLMCAGTVFADHKDIHSERPVIKLADLIQESLKNNAALRSSEHAGVAREAAVGPVSSYDNPELAFEANNYPLRNRGESGSGMRERQVSLSQRVPFPGKLSRLEDAARNEFEAQKEEIRSARALIIKEMKFAYYELFVAYRTYEVLTNQQNIVRGLISTARKQYSLGKSPQAEVLNLQLEEATIVNQILSADRKIKSTLGEINHLLGRTDHSKYIVGRPEEIKITTFKFKENPEVKLFELAAQSNPKIASRKALLAASNSKVAYSKLNLWPDFDFKLGYTFRDQSSDPEAQNSVSAMVGLTLPLWAGSRESEDKRRAFAEKSQAESMLDEEKNDLAHHVHTTYAELEEAYQHLKLFEDATLPLSHQAFTSAQSGYLTGKVEFVTLLSLIQKRARIQLEYAEAQATYQMKVAEMESLTGELSEGS